MAKKKTKGKKIQMEEIEILELLEKYENWLKNDKIQFLKKGTEKHKEILGQIRKLIKDFQKAKEEAENEEKELSETLDWFETHKKGTELWKNLASCALKDIDPESKGNSKLFNFLKSATEFEELLYGLEPYYRDHTLHSLWVYFIGEHLQRDHLSDIYQNPEWYLFNDIERDGVKYKYPPELLKKSKDMKKGFCEKVNENKDAIWCLMALCHDLGYSLSKLSNLNDRVKDVLRYFDIPEFQRIGYSLDIEQQYNVSQFLELMAMEVRIEPSENYRDKSENDGGKPVEWEEKVLIKGYRENSTYWRLCRALEQKKHGILSAYLVYKILSIFADSWVRDPAERWGFDEDEVKDNIIRGNILFGIAQHDFDFAYLNELGSLADILMLADELEEFSRYGRQLTTRKYHDTIANSTIEFKLINLKRGKDIEINIAYNVKKNVDLPNFFKRKTKRLCEIYSLVPRSSSKKNQYENEVCNIKSIKMTVVGINKEELFFTLNRDDDNVGYLPEYKEYLASAEPLSKYKGYKGYKKNDEYIVHPEETYKIVLRDDELHVCVRDRKGKNERKIALNKWIPDQKY